MKITFFGRKFFRRLIPELLLMLCLLGLSGCGKAPAEADRLRIVTTIYPIYDWTAEILGEDDPAELTLLCQNGVDMHSFQPSAADIARIASADLFIYVGGESDDWVTEVLSDTVNPDRRVICLLDELGERVRTEEALPGLPAEEEAEEEEEADEHVWLSLKNAVCLTAAIRDALVSLEPERSAAYTERADAYAKRLQQLDEAYAETFAGLPCHTILLADRFPFRYLTEDYGLSYYAAFPGCSSETEADFETVVFLAERLREEKLPAVLVLDGGDGKMAETVKETAGLPELPVLKLDSLQSVSLRSLTEGYSYLSAMEANLQLLEKALGGE